VGFVRGRIATHTSSSIPILEPVLPSLEDPSKVEKALLPKTTLIGDLKLTLLKSRLASLGISAEFAGEGVLLCSDSSALSAVSNKAASGANGEVGVDIVSVKKQGADHVFVEAAGPSDVYYKVRKEVYGMHAVVGA
jgi:cleavage and polyadenylation specificity factor subunit 2